MKTAIVILAPGFEETEAVTVIDILRRADISTTTVSLSNNPIVPGSHGISLIADAIFDEIPQNFDALVLPGGLRGVENMLHSPALMRLVQQASLDKKVLAAVCAAPLILDALGLLSPNTFTCHPCVHNRPPALPPTTKPPSTTTSSPDAPQAVRSPGLLPWQTNSSTLPPMPCARVSVCKFAFPPFP